MRALKATVTILLDPRVIGPDAQTEWGGYLSDAAAADWMSEVLSQINGEIVLDWGYDGESWQQENGWNIVDIEPEDYEEGEMFADG
jgi:hypothetical protein